MKPSISHFLSTFILTFIRVYRYFLSCLIGNCCRFTPSCSTYAEEAITIHGCLKGSTLTIARILRCHPWCRGGIDPVPRRTNEKVKRC